MADTLVVIPAYNEEASIAETLEELLKHNVGADILVVNDGSGDRTGEAAAGFPVHLVQHPVNLGYGAALQTGYKFALQNGFRYVVQFDADGQHSPDDLRSLIAEMRMDDADIVIGSRFLGNRAFNPGKRKRLAIRVFRTLIYMFTRVTVTDPTSGLRGMNARLFGLYSERGRFPSDFPDADIIIHMLLHRFRLREFPIGSKERAAGTSMHSGLKPIIYMFKVILSIVAVLVNYGLDARRKTNA
ncbi:glycosyl transferase family 2 [Paenibacillus darwinianus]|uniref:Glycosyl transferase family 2 n=1 Tax=Paenibacillus darwinianus TaxID=1380763 RepID=A0A9W5RZX8_9BACL|nr:glycosyltransferase family 2 protein [Paenibacillus darwinianus]EXX85366.1 glycosyl transferase family 2 [Paenibacillus darwinianus]EXX85723.1 glycosyl transferase family 2 [Paenibacillus darwinianus]EXX85749.1 glycosyl transferase family 2 [Paenibacillus darwinianus]